MLHTEYIWNIDDLFTACDYGLDSPTFKIDHNLSSEWGLRLQTNETTNDSNKQDAHLYLILYNHNGSEINIMYKLSIYDMRSHWQGALNSIHEGEAFFKIDKNITLKQLPVWLNYFEGDTKLSLSIKCEITVITSGSCALTTNLDSLYSDFYMLPNDRKFSDVVLVSRDKQRFPAHRYVLGARSPVFASMFEHDMTENQSGIVEIEDIDGQTLSRFLNYIYTGELGIIEVGPMSELLIAAEKYAIDLMKLKIEELLVRELDIDNVFDMLVLAAGHGAVILKERAIIFAVGKGNMIIKTSKFQQLEKTHPDLVIEILKYKWC